MSLTQREAEEALRKFRRTGVKDSRVEAAQKLFKGVEKGGLRKYEFEKRLREAERRPFSHGFEPEQVKVLGKIVKPKLD